MATHVESEVDVSSHRTFIPSRPLLRSITPETSKFWSTRGDLEPTMVNEEGVISALLRLSKARTSPSGMRVGSPVQTPNYNLDGTQPREKLRFCHNFEGTATQGYSRPDEKRDSGDVNGTGSPRDNYSHPQGGWPRYSEYVSI